MTSPGCSISGQNYFYRKICFAIAKFVKKLVFCSIFRECFNPLFYAQTKFFAKYFVVILKVQLSLKPSNFYRSHVSHES